jgi:enoyl-CoA hydratase/carnithine racemase
VGHYGSPCYGFVGKDIKLVLQLIDSEQASRCRDRPLEDLLVASEGSIDVVRLNRPAVLNALRAETFRELGSVLDAFAGDPQKRVLIITGVGDRAFCAGGDIKEMRSMTGKEAAASARLAHRVLAKIEATPKPVIAAVNSLALGAGCDLAIACDVGIASERAVFGEPPAGIGLVTPFGGTQRLPQDHRAEAGQIPLLYGGDPGRAPSPADRPREPRGAPHRPHGGR